MSPETWDWEEKFSGQTRQAWDSSVATWDSAMYDWSGTDDTDWTFETEN